jgi:hypothetical protein
MFNKDVVAAVRELMERHLDVYQIAHRIKLDPILVSQIVDFITDQLT